MLSVVVQDWEPSPEEHMVTFSVMYSIRMQLSHIHYSNNSVMIFKERNNRRAQNQKIDK